MNRERKRFRSWGMLLWYLLLVILSMYVMPVAWIISTEIIGPRTYYAVDLINFTILGILLFGIIYEDFSNRRIKDLFRYFWLAVIGWAIVMISHKVPNPWNRLHVPEYVFVGCLTFRIAYRHVKTTTIYPLLFIAIGVFAFLEECIQSLSPARSFEFADIYIDTITVILALAIMGLAVKPELEEGLPEYLLKQFFHVNTELVRNRFLTNVRYFWFRLKFRIKKLSR